MSFSGQSNAPWQQRNNMNVMSNFHQGQHGPPPPMFVQGPPQQSNMAAFGHAPMQSSLFPPGSGGGGAVAYPQPRTGLNPVAFQQGPGGGGGGGNQSQHYNSIGTVTKINSDCGLVNDEVFFYRNVCKGHAPKLGDRVLFEASHSSSGQFKWNATRIQLMPSHQPQPLMGSGGGAGKGSSGYNAVPPPGEYQGGRHQQRSHRSPRRMSPGTARDRHGVSGGRSDRRGGGERERIHRSRERDDDDQQDRKRRREDHGRSRERNNVGSSQRSAGGVTGNNATRDDAKRDRDHSLDRGKERAERVREQRVERDVHRHRGAVGEHDKDRAEERSPHRSTVKGRRMRTIRRYMVQIPKSLLSYKKADIQELRQRYATLYIPSDFFHANIKWSESFTPDNSFSLRRPCQFHIMHRIVEPPFEQKPELFEPADADYLYSAKVMLMACPPLVELYQKCFEEDDGDNNEQQHTVHPSRLISFLVGTRGRNEPMAIGGPWSKSLDGENPDKDPSVLIRTAIRTCRALTGIDLSHCTQWYRFVELYYHRTDYKNNKNASARIETVVIYLPDVHSCMPSPSDWQNLTQVYKNGVENVIARKTTAAKAVLATKENSSGSATLANSSSNDSKVAADAAGAEAEADTDDGAQDTIRTEEEEAANEEEADDDVEEIPDDDVAEAEDSTSGVATQQDVTADGDDNDNEKDESPEPTHFSKLDLKSMKVQDIREELIARNLPSKGIRNLIMARLAKAINAEKAAEALAKKSAKKQTKSPVVKNKSAVKKTEVDVGAGGADESVTATETITTAAKSQDDANNKIDKDDVEVETETEAEAAENEDNKATDENDEQDEWPDVIDVDMSDIVILDEYDSSKNPEDTPKEMDEKEKNQLIRRYTLPTAPHILVHPSKTAKGGKFDCSVMSLSVLLDYRPEDTKERFFEVSLFAELFNEMLQRDFGFNIYKELFLYKAPESETKSDQSNNKKEESSGTSAQDDDEKSSLKENATETSSNSGDKSSTRRTSKRSIDEEPTTATAAEDDSQSAKSSADRKRKSTKDGGCGERGGKDKEIATDKKMVVVKPQLLLSFVYFDTSHCGYIFEKDLEDLFTILGLNLSRGQIRKVLGKLATRQAFYYRKLTDKEESIEATPTIEDVDDISSDELKKIALGNRQFDAIFGSNNETVQNNDLASTAENNDGLINHNGAVIHVGKLVEQIKRTEKNFSDLEKLYNDLRKQHADLQKDHSKSSSKIKDLQSETKSLNRKLTDSDSGLFSLNRKYRDQQATLSYIYNRVSPYFNRDKDKDHKSESSRDKESDKDKDKDSKSKDKESRDNKDKDKSTREHVKGEEKDKSKDKSKKHGEKEKPSETKQSETAELADVKEAENTTEKDEEMETNNVEDYEEEEEYEEYENESVSKEDTKEE